MNLAENRKGEPISKQSLRVWLRLLKASNMIEGTLRRRLKEDHGTTLPRFDVMSALARNPDGLKMSDVSGLLRVSNGNVTTIVDRLVEDGMVERSQIPGDRRAIEIRLTKAGVDTFYEQAEAHEAWIDSFLSGLGEKNLDQFSTMLETLNTHLEKHWEKENV